LISQSRGLGDVYKRQSLSFHPKEREVTTQIGRKDFTMLLKKLEFRFIFVTLISKRKPADFIVCFIQQEIWKMILNTLKVC
jgi:hypothetical protein